MASLPRIIDVRDDLRRAEDASERDIGEEVSEVLSQLEAYADPEGRHRESLLDTAENTLLWLQEQEPAEKATQRLQTARNRLEIFRGAVSGAGTELVVVDSEIREQDAESGSRGESETRLDRLQEDRVEIRVSVVNLGEPAEGTVEVSFYDDDGTVLRERTAPIALGSDEERALALDAEVPVDAVYHTVIASEATA